MYLVFVLKRIFWAGQWSGPESLTWSCEACTGHVLTAMASYVRTSTSSLGSIWLSSSIEWRSSARQGRGTYGSIFWSFYQPRSGIVLEWLTAFSSWGPFTHDFSLTTQTTSKLCSKSVQPVQTVLLSAFLPRLVFVLLVTYIYMYTVQ